MILVLFIIGLLACHSAAARSKISRKFSVRNKCHPLLKRVRSGYLLLDEITEQGIKQLCTSAELQLQGYVREIEHIMICRY
jgi:hypothetical protein